MCHVATNLRECMPIEIHILHIDLTGKKFSFLNLTGKKFISISRGNSLRTDLTQYLSQGFPMI